MFQLFKNYLKLLHIENEHNVVKYQNCKKQLGYLQSVAGETTSTNTII